MQKTRQITRTDEAMTCTECSGSGACDACDGYGCMLPTDGQNGDGPECVVCSGDGICAECQGTGD